MSAGVLTLNDSNFEADVIKSDKPVLVDFWAEWCGPCQRIAPLVEELAKENAGKMKVGKLDIDENPDTAGNYGVNSIPTLIVFKNGKEVDRVVGALPKSQLQALVDRHA